MLYNRIRHLEVFAYLTQQDRWCTQREITNATGIGGSEMRRIANYHPQTYIGGQRGYRLVKQATGDEIENAVRCLLSRAEKIMHRARSLQRYTFERNRSARRLARLAGR